MRKRNKHHDKSSTRRRERKAAKARRREVNDPLSPRSYRCTYRRLDHPRDLPMPGMPEVGALLLLGRTAKAGGGA